MLYKGAMKNITSNPWLERVKGATFALPKGNPGDCRDGGND
jgi:hypothetical protein